MSAAREVRRGARGPDPVRRLARRAGVGALTAVMATGAALPLVATPAGASLTGPGVDPGRNVTVFHDIDMVAISGYGTVAGNAVSVEVRRNGERIGIATGRTLATPDGVGLEVNHGVDGTPEPGECWTGAAPDILPKDQIVVHFGDDVDEVTVDDIHYTRGPVADGEDVIVEGVAVRADGTTAITAAELDSAAFRSNSGKYRTTPEVEPRPGVLGGFTLRYSKPYLSADGRNRDGISEAQRRDALLSQNGHAVGFGHTDPLPLESQFIDGLANVPGHAPGCGGTPHEAPGPEPFEPEPEPRPNPDPGTNPAPAPPTTRTLKLDAKADTMARQSSPYSKYGSVTVLKSDTQATKSRTSRETSYLKFAVPKLAAGETITGARLSLHVTDGTTNGPKVQRTATGWWESRLTWKSQPGRIGSANSADFGKLTAGKRSSVALSLAGISSSGTVSFRLYADSNDGMSFHSRESGKKPVLVLTIRKG